LGEELDLEGRASGPRVFRGKSQSSNRYSVVGEVHGWVKVPFNEARYGRDAACGDIVCNNTWFLIRDAMSYRVQSQIALGKSDAGDQAAGDPHQGTDAIWSHRWYASVQAGGPSGLTGVNIGSGGVSGRLRGGIPDHPAASGSATTRSSPRTAASACSRTSTATISACRISAGRRASDARALVRRPADGGPDPDLRLDVRS
jgi:hypothetical protein